MNAIDIMDFHIQHGDFPWFFVASPPLSVDEFGRPNIPKKMDGDGRPSGQLLHNYKKTIGEWEIHRKPMRNPWENGGLPSGKCLQQK